MGDWRPSATSMALKARAELYRQIRRFFEERDYLEVEPPLLARGGTTDPSIESFRSRFGGDDFYLQTSPEFAMKRMLAAGSGPIYAICKVFRQGEEGRFHNPEFSMLEWYRPGFDDHQLMQEVGELLSGIFPVPVEKKSYRQIFVEHLGLDPHTASVAELRDCTRGKLEVGWEDQRRDVWLDLLFSHFIQPTLDRNITFVYDYPATQAALARVQPDLTGQPVARRFEVFHAGSELANGYWELTDATEQLGRFVADNEVRGSEGLPLVRSDDRLIEALASGLPNCAGVALGLDRLLMLMIGARRIQDVIAFPWSRV
ncbi:EF-P lysine aminoacylase EpmA [Gilvimarinus sp. F26214L]|uniref:EF-P lysine aminoacylase EpmA n=1 Tax=Gilvimarinus sp. DZF01 TaxID=3461371 RepID=UPI004045B3CC